MHIDVRVQKNKSNSLKLDLQLIVSHLMWVLGAEPRFSARAVGILNHSDLSPDMCLLVKIVYLNLDSACTNLKNILE